MRRPASHSSRAPKSSFRHRLKNRPQSMNETSGHKSQSLFFCGFHISFTECGAILAVATARNNNLYSVTLRSERPLVASLEGRRPADLGFTRDRQQYFAAQVGYSRLAAADHPSRLARQTTRSHLRMTSAVSLRGAKARKQTSSARSLFCELIYVDKSLLRRSLATISGARFRIICGAVIETPKLCCRRLLSAARSCFPGTTVARFPIYAQSPSSLAIASLGDGGRMFIWTCDWQNSTIRFEIVWLSTLDFISLVISTNNSSMFSLVISACCPSQFASRSAVARAIASGTSR